MRAEEKIYVLVAIIGICFGCEFWVYVGYRPTERFSGLEEKFKKLNHEKRTYHWLGHHWSGHQSSSSHP